MISKSALLVTLCVLLHAGCAMYAPVPRAARRVRTGALGGMDFLSAALDEAPEEIVRLLRPEPEEILARLGRKPRMQFSYNFGVRTGVLLSGDAERDWDSTMSTGVFLRQVPLMPRKLSLEAGLEYAMPETGDGTVSSNLILVRADALLGRFGTERSAPYVFVGGQAIVETAKRNVTGKTDSGFGGGAELGLGLTTSNGRWDLRAVYSVLFASENTKDNFAVQCGYVF